MCFVTTQPEMLASAASQLQGIGAEMTAHNAAAAASTTAVVPAAADEVSALTPRNSALGLDVQAVGAQAAAVHEMFVRTLGASANSYGATEAANASAARSMPLS